MTLLEKLHVQHGNRSIYIKPKSTIRFGIRHYAGIVMYNPHGFLEKNRDSFSMDLKEIILKSKNKMLLDIFPRENHNETMKKQPTLSIKFRNSLELLMKTLSSAHPFFIRCIKPNEEKKANVSMIILKKVFYINMWRFKFSNIKFSNPFSNSTRSYAFVSFAIPA